MDSGGYATMRTGFVGLQEIETSRPLLSFDKDDVALLEFSYRFLKQVLFAEETIPLRDGALDARINRTDKSLEELQAEQDNKGGDTPDIEPVDIA